MCCILITVKLAKLCCFFTSLGRESVSLLALVCVLTISCVSSSDGRGWNLVLLSKKTVKLAKRVLFCIKVHVYPS